MGNIADVMATLRKKGPIMEDQDPGVPFDNDKISKIMDFYQLTSHEIYDIFGVFRKMDSMGTGYINLDNIYSLIGEEVGIISPYLERFFSLIKKQHVDKANFLEFLPVLATFCLYTRQQLISFVFCMLDTDHNGFISKKDMLTFVCDERFGLPIFSQNFLLSIDALELERPDRISFEQFLSLEQDILFLIYPLNRLQKGLQKVFGGRRLWEVIYTRILRLEKDEEKKNANFHSGGAKKKTSGTSEQKLKHFEEFLIKKGIASDFKSETNHLPIRELNRRGSGSRIKTKLPRLLRYSPKRHRSLIYKKREFVVVDEDDETTNAKNAKNLKKPKKSKLNPLQRLPSLLKKEHKEPKFGKSVTSVNSSRKKVNPTSRKSSLESRNSIVGVSPGSEVQRKKSLNLNEKSQINSGPNSRLNLRQQKSNEGIRSINSLLQ